MSGPKPNARSAPPTCLPSRPRRWWTCWSMRCSIADLWPWPHRVTASTNRRRCGGSTGRRSTPSPAPTSTPRSGSSTPSNASSPPPAAATGSGRRVGGGSGSAGDGGERHRPGCRAGVAGPADVHLRCPSAAGDRPRRRREDHRHARPHPGLDRRRRPGDRPRPVRGRSRRPRRANRHPHRHPRQTHLVPAARRAARTGRPRSDRRPW